MTRLILMPLLALALGGCVRTAASIVTFPVKAAGQGIDWATTSQDEADRNYGRKVRKQEAKDGRRLRREQKARERAWQRRND